MIKVRGGSTSTAVGLRMAQDLLGTTRFDAKAFRIQTMNRIDPAQIVTVRRQADD